jgi:uncharacterized membrane protein
MRLLSRRAPELLAALFGASGVVHLIRPATFEPLIPRWLPNPRGIVYASGIAEVVCAIGLVRRTRWAGPTSAALLIAVFPGNIQMAIDSLGEHHGRLTPKKLVAFARLPLQIPLIWAALQASKHESATVVTE